MADLGYLRTRVMVENTIIQERTFQCECWFSCSL